MVKFTLSIPNWITLIRVGLIPIFVFLLIDPSEWMIKAAVYIFVFAAITDYLDGFIARWTKSVSDFGKLLDPLADKILVLSALVMLTSLKSDPYGDPWVPGWMTVLVLAREIWVTGLRGVAASQGTVVAAASSGKVKSGLQMVAVVFLLLHQMKLNILGAPLTAHIIGLNLLLISLFFSYWGAYQYTVIVFTGPSSSDDEKSPSA